VGLSAKLRRRRMIRCSSRLSHLRQDEYTHVKKVAVELFPISLAVAQTRRVCDRKSNLRSAYTFVPLGSFTITNFGKKKGA
jgi:hypothetical protein